MCRVLVPVDDPEDPRLADFLRLTDMALRTTVEPERGLYLAESEKVIRRALDAGHRPRSFLMAPRWVDELPDLLARAEQEGVPVYVGEHPVILREGGTERGQGLRLGAEGEGHRRGSMRQSG